ncbi:hypothetical protein NHQ30_002102 [Ciborinia camelliae]|nr:hypothetical protein NHQ30_002102 [Ciborinia camelliae]
MVALSKIIGLLLAGGATALNQATNSEHPLTQALSSLQAIEFQELGAAWTVGIMDALKKHGNTLKETAEATYAQIPSEFLDGVEKVHAQVIQTFSSPQIMEFQKLSAEWITGVVDAFKKHGTTLKETAEATYAQMPPAFRDEVEKAHAQVYETEWKDLPADIQRWIQDNPYQTAFYVVNGIVFFAPATSSGPILWALGFSGKGPRAASFASMLHSKFCMVGAKSPFSYIQSAGMGGYGVPAVNMAMRLGAVASSLIGGLLKPGEAGKNGTAKL